MYAQQHSQNCIQENKFQLEQIVPLSKKKQQTQRTIQKNPKIYLDAKLIKILIINMIIVLSFVFLFLANSKSDLLTPQEIKDVMFTSVITGYLKIATPIQTKKLDDKVIEQSYKIEALKTTHSFLPQGFPSTPIYAYQTLTDEGIYAGFPSAGIRVEKGVSVKITWVNNILGAHILPMDQSYPFNETFIPKNQVPICPHLHGASVQAKSDGLPEKFWTASGYKSPAYQTQEPCKKNEAVFKYPNEQEPAYLFFHDHTMSITRLNYYAGMLGIYEISEKQNETSFAEKQIKKKYGKLQKLYFVVADKSFYKNGSLFYPDKAENPKFTSWVPQFFGDMITVNGKVWPKVNLQKKVYRMVFLNACQSRYLNMFFIDTKTNKIVPYQIIKFEGDFLQKQVTVDSHLLSLSARMQIIIDLTLTQGDVMLRNDAKCPYPDGDDCLMSFDSQIMKIQINQTTKTNNEVKQLENAEIILKENFIFPKFPQGTKVVEVLNEAMYMDGDDEYLSGALIGGTFLHKSRSCQGSIFEAGKIYDFHIVNLTPDSHPLHFHLVNFQKIYAYQFDVQRYMNDWHNNNGGPTPQMGYDKMATAIDPQAYRKENIIYPSLQCQSFRDIVDAHPGQVTVIRVKFSHIDGSPFSFPVKGKRYVWHCHILQHQDNQMMKYFCME